MVDRAVLTVEEAIAQADAIPPLPSEEEFARLSLVAKLDVGRHAGDRDDLRRAVIAGRVTAALYVQDLRCDQAFTVLGYLKHSSQVQHAPGDVVPAPSAPDERDRGRGGESRTAALS